MNKITEHDIHEIRLAAVYAGDMDIVQLCDYCEELLKIINIHNTVNQLPGQ